MITRLLRMIATVKGVRRDMQPWVHHLTGEGPATVRRQREAADQVLATAPLDSIGPSFAYERYAPPEVPTVAAITRQRAVLMTR
jgi:hypothetical protein